MVAIPPQMEAHVEKQKMGETQGLYFNTASLFFKNSPSTSSDLEGEERPSKLFHY